MRYMELVRAVAKKTGTNTNSMRAQIWRLDQLDTEFIKPERGLFKLACFEEDNMFVTKRNVQKCKEDEFYSPFAEWLVKELDDCTEAAAVGGCIFKDKWGTPDVIGVKEAKKTDILKFPTQLISAEIKTDANNLITAFGQACAYKLFSHKSYLVIPKKSGEDDLARMDSLCLLHGIGLIHFDNENAEYPGFEIRNRATIHEPDLFYTNRYVKILADQKSYSTDPDLCVSTSLRAQKKYR